MVLIILSLYFVTATLVLTDACLEIKTEIVFIQSG